MESLRGMYCRTSSIFDLYQFSAPIPYSISFDIDITVRDLPELANARMELILPLTLKYS